MIDVKELRKSFASIHVLNGVDVHVKRGECICIIGPRVLANRPFTLSQSFGNS